MSPTSLELQPFPWLSSADVQWLLCVGTLVAVVPVAVVVVLVAVVPVAVVAVMPVLLTEPLAGPGSGAVPAGTGWLPTRPWSHEALLCRGACTAGGVSAEPAPGAASLCPGHLRDRADAGVHLLQPLQPGLSSPAPVGKLCCVLCPCWLLQQREK